MEALWIPGSVSKTASGHSVRSSVGPRVSLLPKMRNLRLREESKADSGHRAVARQVEVEVEAWALTMKFPERPPERQQPEEGAHGLSVMMVQPRCSFGDSF